MATLPVMPSMPARRRVTVDNPLYVRLRWLTCPVRSFLMHTYAYNSDYAGCAIADVYADYLKYCDQFSIVKPSLGEFLRLVQSRLVICNDGLHFLFIKKRSTI